MDGVSQCGACNLQPAGMRRGVQSTPLTHPTTASCPPPTPQCMSVVLLVGSLILTLSGLVSVNRTVEWKGVAVTAITGVIMAGVSAQGLQYANDFSVFKVCVGGGATQVCVGVCGLGYARRAVEASCTLAPPSPSPSLPPPPVFFSLPQAHTRWSHLLCAERGLLGGCPPCGVHGTDHSQATARNLPYRHRHRVCGTWPHGAGTVARLPNS
jgi:hypothetical protein